MAGEGAGKSAEKIRCAGGSAGEGAAPHSFPRKSPSSTLNFRSTLPSTPAIFLVSPFLKSIAGHPGRKASGLCVSIILKPHQRRVPQETKTTPPPPPKPKINKQTTIGSCWVTETSHRNKSRGFEKGLAGGGWRRTGAKIQRKLSPELCSPSPKGGIGKRHRNEA